jgi:hypothetical protein
VSNVQSKFGRESLVVKFGRKLLVVEVDTSYLSSGHKLLVVKGHASYLWSYTSELGASNLSSGRE